MNSEPKEEEDDPRIASAPDGYQSDEAAIADLNEAERIRYLYISRTLYRSFVKRESFDASVIPILRATAHDEAIRNVAAIRRNGYSIVAWNDVRASEDESRTY